MRFLRGLRALALVPLVSLAIYAPACSHDHGTPVAGAEDVVYDPHGETANTPVDGNPTDEALSALLAATPVSDASRSASVEAPTAGAEVPGDPPLAFRWRIGPASSPSDGGTGSRARPMDALYTFREMFGRERSAWAHLAPFNGTAFLLVFSTSKNDKLLRVFTKNTSYTPEAAAWTKLKEAGEAITLTVTVARFTNNQVDSDGGPFKGTPLTFTVKR